MNMEHMNIEEMIDIFKKCPEISKPAKLFPGTGSILRVIEGEVVERGDPSTVLVNNFANRLEKKQKLISNFDLNYRILCDSISILYGLENEIINLLTKDKTASMALAIDKAEHRASKKRR